MNSLNPLLLLTLLILAGCSPSGKEETTLTDLAGSWRGVLYMQDKETPFNFEITETGDSLQMRLFNGEETLVINDLYRKGDSLYIPMHIFDTELQVVVGSGRMEGAWVKNYTSNYQIPFTATKNNFRFPAPKNKPSVDLSGKWDVSFRKNNITEARKAIGLFKQDGNQLSGTFLTTTGDYRFLEGIVDNHTFKLSSFDGENAYLFEGELTPDDQITGTFWSGKSREEKWTAVRNENASLPSADTLTYLKEGYDRLSFTFPNLQGEPVSLSDPQYQDKVVIVQLFGTWCPNCMDETRFLADWYRKNKEKDVEIIGLAYELKDDFDYARKRVQRMADKLNVGYDFLIAGTSQKDAASRSLPMLNHVMSFPTTIFIDKEGKVRKIHTGFSGPGTGEYYTRFVEDFNTQVEKLLAE